ncbi:hypothetical protein QUF72_11015 [Desulfobacterales bacterium HSG2]|nr:hypothetical protein [Desulfobacterales bacterium HSG2]
MHCCAEMENYVQENELPIIFIAKFREYCIRYSDGGSSVQLVGYCPWWHSSSEKPSS